MTVGRGRILQVTDVPDMALSESPKDQLSGDSKHARKRRLLERGQFGGGRHRSLAAV